MEGNEPSHQFKKNIQTKTIINQQTPSSRSNKIIHFIQTFTIRTR